MHSLAYLALAVLNSLRTENENFESTELSAYEDD